MSKIVSGKIIATDKTDRGLMSRMCKELQIRKEKREPS